MEEQKSNPGIKWAKWLVLAIGIAILAVVWILNGGLKQTPSPSPSSFPNATSSTSTNNAAVPPQPRSAVNIKAESGKFVPDSFTAQKGKVLTINLTAVDNTYDFGFEDRNSGLMLLSRKARQNLLVLIPAIKNRVIINSIAFNTALRRGWKVF